MCWVAINNFYTYLCWKPDNICKFPSLEIHFWLHIFWNVCTCKGWVLRFLSIKQVNKQFRFGCIFSAQDNTSCPTSPSSTTCSTTFVATCCASDQTRTTSLCDWRSTEKEKTTFLITNRTRSQIQNKEKVKLTINKWALS